MIERQFDANVKVVRSDNGTKFNCMRDYFQHNGILFQTSCVDTPQQNGRVERKHHHILNIAQALRFQANLPLSFWGDCVLAASYIITRTPSPLLEDKSPYEVLFNTSPSYDTLRVFGCLCYAHNIKSKRDKFIVRSRKCIFVGYPQGKKGWKLYDLETGEYFVSRDVKFYETEFPFAHNTPSTSSSPTNIVTPNFDYIGDSYDDLLGLGASRNDDVNDGSVVHEKDVTTSPTSSNGVVFTCNKNVQSTSIVSHEIGGSECAANAPGNNVASNIESNSSLRGEDVTIPTALDDD
ncbi:unnamed protein product [Amaranthus hypochondriacus]